MQENGRRDAAVGPARSSGARPEDGTRFFLGALGGALGRVDVDLAGLIQHSGDAIAILDRDDVVRYWNRSAEALFGYSSGEILGRPLAVLVPPDLVEQGELRSIREALDACGTVANRVTRRLRRDGESLWVSLTRSVLSDARGVPAGSVAVFRDLGEQRRMQQELFEAREKALLGDLAANLAHEIKNGLAGIYAAMQILAGALPPGDRGRAWFDEAALEIKRLDATTQDLLSFAGQPAPHPTPADLGEFLRTIAQRARDRPEVQPHRIEVSAPPDLVAAVDAVLLGQALLNLIANAAQAMSSPGSIRLSAERAEGGVRIEIQDSGPGILPEYLGSIFVPFFTTKTRGTGLGLPIAKKNVEAHGGTLRARNLEGGGSVFTVELPAVEAELAGC